MVLNHEYLDWRSAEEMHNNSIKWLSELNFVSDEENFLDNLLGEYFIQLSTQKQYPETKKLVKNLSESKKQTKKLLKKVEKHNNDLYVLLDRIDQPFEEKEIKATHRELIKNIDAFLHDFKELKMNIFTIIVSIMKHDKETRLLN